MKPFIVVTGAHKTQDGLLEHQLFHHYVEALRAAGGFPMLAPDADQDDAICLAGRADGLLLTGGVDIAPQYYGETKLPACGIADPLRDRLELLLIQAFLTERKPIFGICRGLQMINVMLGGTLYQDIPGQLKKPHTYNSVHPATAVTGSLFHRLFGDTFAVNSLHHQAIRQPGRDLIPAVYSEDGTIVEAVVHRALPIIGVQWHPERMTGPNRWTADGPDMSPLFGEFIALCSKTGPVLS